MKLGFKQYWKPTPKLVRKFGDALLGASTLALTYAAVNGNEKYAMYAALAGIIGKFLTNFVGEQSLNDKAKEQ